MVAVLLLLAWIVHVVWNSWHGRNHHTEVGLSMMALVFASAFFSGDFYDSRLMFIFGVLAVSSADIGSFKETFSGRADDEGYVLRLARMTPGGSAADEG